MVKFSAPPRRTDSSSGEKGVASATELGGLVDGLAAIYGEDPPCFVAEIKPN